MSPSKTTTTAAAAAATDADTKPEILLQPVAIYDTPLSRAVSVGRVAVLLGLLAWGMDSLVAEPASALSRALPVVAAVQAVYAAVCIPPAGSSSSSSPGSSGKAKKPRPGEKPKKHDGGGGGGGGGTSTISSVIVALVLSALTVPALHALLVLFGAPLLDHAPRTALCAAHVALLAAFPVVRARGLDRSALVGVAGAAAPLDEPFGALVGVAAGAWLGAVPIPLDWDRDWQRWPVTVVIGAYLGAAAGSLLAGTVLFGRRIAGSAAKAD